MLTLLSTLLAPAPAPTPAALVPTLRDAVNKKKRHFITDLYPGDQLHTTRKVLGFPKGRRLPIYGFCALYDEAGQLYQVRAYVRPGSYTQKALVQFTSREAVRFRFENQREQWFGAVLMHLVEIDLTDYADCLRLERLSERVLPLLPAAVVVPAFPQAA